MPLALIRDVVSGISNAPMCAAVAQRQLVRRSSVGPRKTGVDTKLVGKHSQTWSWGWWRWGGGGGRG